MRATIVAGFPLRVACAAGSAPTMIDEMTPRPRADEAPGREPGPPADDPPRRDATLREVFGAVFWSFFGVRKGRHMQRDALTIRPHQVVIVGVVCGALFVLALLLVVRIVIRSAGA